LGHLYIVPEGSSTASLDRAADGTGPYRVASWQPGRRLELTRHVAHAAVAPALDAVRFDLSLAPAEIARMVAAGETDVALLGQVEDEAHIDPARVRLHRRGSLMVRYLGFDLASERTAQLPGRPNPLRDRRVREAFHLALDRAALAAGLPSHASPAAQLVPRYVFGFDVSIAQPQRDLARARELLAAAGFRDGLELPLHTREILRTATAPLARQLWEAGIRISPQVLPDRDYLPGIARRAFSLWLDRWSCTTGDSGELFQNAFHTPDPARGFGDSNESGYRDPEFDRAIEAALLVENLTTRREALAGLMRQAMQELLWVPLFTDEEVWAVSRSFIWRPRGEFWLFAADLSPADH
jgi:peptide/nickel transport system substrate-binding protein